MEYKLGDVIVYPMDRGEFYTLLTIPTKQIVQDWLEHLQHEEINTTGITNPDEWMNKEAIIIRSSYGEIVALYKHDDDWYLIKNLH